MFKSVLFALFFGQILLNCLFSQTLGDAILQSREVEMNSLQDRFSPLREKQVSSALSNVSRIDGSIQLVDPKEGIPSFTLLEVVKVIED